MRKRITEDRNLAETMVASKARSFFVSLGSDGCLPEISGSSRLWEFARHSPSAIERAACGAAEARDYNL
ncbi:MAG: hypothetical protein B9S28_03505 [Opitutia bacterium Tous-C10FEB]|nr:MAG: hypothetical protein B9S28_03505 [Opitutae bacterium Tous-C10FEB]